MRATMAATATNRTQSRASRIMDASKGEIHARLDPAHAENLPTTARRLPRRYSRRRLPPRLGSDVDTCVCASPHRHPHDRSDLRDERCNSKHRPKSHRRNPNDRSRRHTSARRRRARRVGKDRSGPWRGARHHGLAVLNLRTNEKAPRGIGRAGVGKRESATPDPRNASSEDTLMPSNDPVNDQDILNGFTLLHQAMVTGFDTLRNELLNELTNGNFLRSSGHRARRR